VLVKTPTFFAHRLSVQSFVRAATSTLDFIYSLKDTHPDRFTFHVPRSEQFIGPERRLKSCRFSMLFDQRMGCPIDVEVRDHGGL